MFEESRPLAQPALFFWFVLVCALPACGSGSETDARPAASTEWHARWLRTAGDGASQFAYGAAIDGRSNVVVVGEYGGQLNFGGAPLGNAATTSGFVVKFDPAGRALWSRRIGGSGDASAYVVAVDARDHVFVGGWFKGDLEGRRSAGETDAYLLELDEGGALASLQTFGDAASQTVTAIAIHESTVVVAGDFDGAIDLGSGVLRSAGQSDIFVAAFEAGSLRFSKRFGGPDHDRRPRLAINDEAIYLAGTYRGRIDVGSGPLVDAYDGAFLARFSRSGDLAWSKSVAGDGWCFPTSLAVSASGDVAMGARFTKSLALGREVKSESGEDALVAVFSATGAVRSAQRFGGFGQDAISSVGFAGNDLYVVGELQTELGSLTSAGGADAFVARVEGDELTWVQQLGDAEEQRAVRLAIDPRGGVVVVGNYFGQIVAGTHRILSNGGFETSGGDVFIASFGPR